MWQFYLEWLGYVLSLWSVSYKSKQALWTLTCICLYRSFCNVKDHSPARVFPQPGDSSRQVWGTLWSVGRAGSNGGSLSSVLQPVPGEILTWVHAGNIRGCSLSLCVAAGSWRLPGDVGGNMVGTQPHPWARCSWENQWSHCAQSNMSICSKHSYL